MMNFQCPSCYYFCIYKWAHPDSQKTLLCPWYKKHPDHPLAKDRVKWGTSI